MRERETSTGTLLDYLVDTREVCPEVTIYVLRLDRVGCLNVGFRLDGAGRTSIYVLFHYVIYEKQYVYSKTLTNVTSFRLNINF